MWPCRAEACKTIVKNYKQILAALKSIYKGIENSHTITDDKSLWTNMIKRETRCM